MTDSTNPMDMSEADLKKRQRMYWDKSESNSYTGSEVDLLIGLLVPKNDHETYLEMVAEIAKLFRRKSFRERLHHASSSEELYLTAIGANNAK